MPTPYSEPLPSAPRAYSAAAWHRARLELLGLMVQNREALPEHLLEWGRWLYGAADQGMTEHQYQRKHGVNYTEARYRSHVTQTRRTIARHQAPPWSPQAADYVAQVYSLIEECTQHINLRRAA